jgi:hypothetical protein
VGLTKQFETKNPARMGEVLLDVCMDNHRLSGFIQIWIKRKMNMGERDGQESATGIAERAGKRQSAGRRRRPSIDHNRSCSFSLNCTRGRARKRDAETCVGVKR